MNRHDRASIKMMRQNNFKQAKSYWGAMLAISSGMIASSAEAAEHVVGNLKTNFA